MPKAPPFTEIADGQPVWTLEVEDPQDAQAYPAELRLRRLSLPGGDILALALRLYDVARRPQLHHLAGPLDRPEVRAWALALADKGSVRVVLRRAGWATSFERNVGIAPGDAEGLRAPVGASRDPEGAIRHYLDAYRAELPRLHQPEAVWDLLARSPAAAPARKGSGAWIWVLLLLAAAAAVAWWFLGR